MSETNLTDHGIWRRIAEPSIGVPLPPQLVAALQESYTDGGVTSARASSQPAAWPIFKMQAARWRATIGLNNISISRPPRVAMRNPMPAFKTPTEKASTCGMAKISRSLIGSGFLSSIARDHAVISASVKAVRRFIVIPSEKFAQLIISLFEREGAQ